MTSGLAIHWVIRTFNKKPHLISLTDLPLKSPLELASVTLLYAFHLLLWPSLQIHSSLPAMLEAQSQVSSLLSQPMSLSNSPFKGSAIKDQAHDLPHRFVLLPLFPISMTVTAVPSNTKSEAYLSLTTYVRFTAS